MQQNKTGYFFLNTVLDVSAVALTHWWCQLGVFSSVAGCSQRI